MNEKQDSIVVEHPDEQLSLAKYIAGFVGSITLTLAAYLLVTHSSYSKGFIMIVLTVLAIVQFVVQMVLFLHVGAERKPRWKLAVMLMMLSVVLILVFGSLWIMNNLDYRMSQQQVRQYLKSQDSL
jgi:cytochrome o ubiquinol oxidase operon protein cyoD